MLLNIKRGAEGGAGVAATMRKKVEPELNEIISTP